MGDVCTHIFDTEFISDGDEQIFDTEFAADEKVFDAEYESIVGKRGYSPTVDVTEIENGHRVTITDIEGEKSFDVMDGAVDEEQLRKIDERLEETVKTVNGVEPDENGNVEIQEDCEALSNMEIEKLLNSFA